MAKLERLKPTTFLAKPEQLTRLKLQSELTGAPVSEMIRRAIDLYLRTECHPRGAGYLSEQNRPPQTPLSPSDQKNYDKALKTLEALNAEHNRPK